MNLKELSDLINIRSYIALNIENPSVFSENKYKKASSKLQEIDNIISNFILNANISDLIEKQESISILEDVTYPTDKLKLKEEKPSKQLDMFNDLIEKPESKSVKKTSKKTSTTQEVKKSNVPNIEEDSEDQAMINEMIAKEKEKIKGKIKK